VGGGVDKNLTTGGESTVNMVKKKRTWRQILLAPSWGGGRMGMRTSKLGGSAGNNELCGAKRKGGIGTHRFGTEKRERGGV